ncbi:MAG: hypothetical protein L6R40_004630 [Gallowayella cf. fulva]|nr:MAG: hypothetical protein L6R40_004630 [Xanthomendoza cf. fulva]
MPAVLAVMLQMFASWLRLSAFAAIILHGIRPIVPEQACSPTSASSGDAARRRENHAQRTRNAAIARAHHENGIGVDPRPLNTPEQSFDDFDGSSSNTSQLSLLDIGPPLLPLPPGPQQNPQARPEQRPQPPTLQPLPSRTEGDRERRVEEWVEEQVQSRRGDDEDDQQIE